MVSGSPPVEPAAELCTADVGCSTMSGVLPVEAGVSTIEEEG
jgi:hypothetical protein